MVENSTIRDIQIFDDSDLVVLRNPVAKANATSNAATPTAMPAMATPVMTETAAWRRLARR